VEEALRVFRSGLNAYDLMKPEEGWQVEESDETERASVLIRERRILLPKRKAWTRQSIMRLFRHELEGHVLRAESGRCSALQLLGIGFAGQLAAEEGLASLLGQGNNLPEMPAEENGKSALLVVGLALGSLSQPRSFRQVFTFLRDYWFVEAMQQYPEEDDAVAWNEAERKAYRRCLRTFRGGSVPGSPLWCLPKDLAYADGKRQLATMFRGHSNRHNQALLNLLRVGRTSFHPCHLRTLRELGIVQPLIAPRDLCSETDFIAQFWQ